MGENAGFMQSRPCEAVLVLWVDVLEVVSWWESTGFTQSRPCEAVVVLWVDVLEVVCWWERE